MVSCLASRFARSGSSAFLFQPLVIGEVLLGIAFHLVFVDQFGVLVAAALSVQIAGCRFSASYANGGASVFFSTVTGCSSNFSFDFMTTLQIDWPLQAVRVRVARGKFMPWRARPARSSK